MMEKELAFTEVLTVVGSKDHAGCLIELQPFESVEQELKSAVYELDFGNVARLHELGGFITFKDRCVPRVLSLKARAVRLAVFIG